MLVQRNWSGEMTSNLELISHKWSFIGIMSIFLLLPCVYKLFRNMRNIDVAKEAKSFLCCFLMLSLELGLSVVMIQWPHSFRQALLTQDDSLPDSSLPALSAWAAPSFDGPILAGPYQACPRAPPFPGSSSSHCAGFASGGPSPHCDCQPEASCAPLFPFWKLPLHLNQDLFLQRCSHFSLPAGNKVKCY